MKKVGIIESMLDLTSVTNDVLMVNGVHGIGKSEKIANWAKDNNRHCFSLLTSTMEPSDLTGLPMFDERNNSTAWAKPDWFQQIIDLDKEGVSSVLFLDELNRGNVETLNTCLELCLNKRIHTHVLPKTCMIVAATNPSNGKYRVQRLDPALVNRFLVINYEASVSEWLQWGKDQDVHPAVLSFISKNEDKLVYSDERSEQSATPRSWHMLSKNLKVLEEKGHASNNEMLRTMLVGKVGVALGGQFYNFYREFSKLVDPKDVIDFVKKQKFDVANFQANLEEIADKMSKKLLKDVEHINLISLTEKLLKQYFADEAVTITDKSTLEDKKYILPLTAMLYSLPIEVAASIVKQYKSTPEYSYLILGDVNKTLARKLFNIKF